MNINPHCVYCKKMPVEIDPDVGEFLNFCGSTCHTRLNQETYIFHDTIMKRSDMMCGICPNMPLMFNNIFLSGCCNSHIRMSRILGRGARINGKFV
jgi:hypothetical protein